MAYLTRATNEPDRRERQHVQRLVDVARLYYEEGLTQQEIAQRIDMSRLSVNRLLNEARQAGIVNIEIREPFLQAYDLREAVLHKYWLKDAVVVPSFDETPEDIAVRIGRAAALHLDRLLEQQDAVVGVGWGRTVYEVSRAFHSNRLHRAHFLPLIGSIAEMTKYFRPNDIVRRLAEACGSTWSPLQVPFMMDSSEIRQWLMKDSSVKKVVDQWDELDVGVVGIGSSIDRSPILRSNYFDRRELADLERQHMSGDICSRYFDHDGNPCSWNIDHRLIAITLEQLKKTPNVIAVAGGRSKVGPIRAALNAKYIDTLVTDEQTARSLVGV